MVKDLTKGPPTRVILAFSLPIMAGNIFQQLYNVADSIIVGKAIGNNALAAVGSSFMLMNFITSILLGLSIGASVVFSQFFGAKKYKELKASISTSFLFIGALAVLICVLTLCFADWIIWALNIPPAIVEDIKTYLMIIFVGTIFTFLFNWASGVLRALGNSRSPLYFLIISTVLNVVLDLLFVLQFHMGIAGAAYATVISQLVSAVLAMWCCVKNLKFLEFRLQDLKFDKSVFKITAGYSLLTSAQQSFMNFGILMIQGLVNTYGPATMTAYAAATKIDAFCCMPIQDFGNAFSTFVAQNKGAGKDDRIQDGLKRVVLMIAAISLLISSLVWIFARELIWIFVDPTETQIIEIGVGYLKTVGVFYCLLGYLQMFYGVYRGLGLPQMSIVLTVLSLGSRVLLAYMLSPLLGMEFIWWSIPIGWSLADLTGLLYYGRAKRKVANRQLMSSG